MPPKRLGRYTAEEVAEHNTAKSLWVIMNRKVYDVTIFHKRHPGGAAVLLQMGGKDATAAATAAHKSILPGNLMFEFCIGSLCRKKEPEPEAAPAPAAAPVKEVESARNKEPKASSDPPSGQKEGSGPPSAGTPSPRIAAKTKAKTKPKAVNTAKATQEEQPGAGSPGVSPTEAKSRAGSVSSGSRSVQGSDVEQDHSDPIDSEKSCELEIASATSFLHEKMSLDPRLSRWVEKSGKTELLFEMRRFLLAALDGSDLLKQNTAATGPMTMNFAFIKELTSRLESVYDDLVDLVVSVMRKPFPLGEERLVAAVGALSKDLWTDQRVLQLVEHIRGPSDEPARKSTRGELNKQASFADLRSEGATPRADRALSRGASARFASKEDVTQALNDNTQRSTSPLFRSEGNDSRAVPCSCSCLIRK